MSVCGDGGSGGGGALGGSGNFKVPSLSGLQLIIRYSWLVDQEDLDTGTKFLGEQVGYACGSSPYMSFSRDNTGFGGTETIVVQVDQALQDRAWADTTTVFLRAGWYIPARGSGPADARIVLQNRTTMDEIPGTGLSIVSDPGSQSGCAAFLVGEAVLTVVDDGVTIDLSYVPAR